MTRSCKQLPLIIYNIFRNFTSTSFRKFLFLLNNNNPSAVRIRQALTDIKSIAKVPLENVAQQGQTFVA